MNKTKSFSNMRLTRALLAVGLVAAVRPAFAQDAAPAKTDKDATVQLDTFQITGSRIKRVDAETPLPVVRLTRQDLDFTGYTTVGDALRNMPFNTGGSIDPQRTSTFASSSRSVNLRGLGSQNTLVLINGRRTAPFGLPGNNGFNAVFDLNSLPVAAIESIEVLKDGASAIYGSDAVAGVINITLRKQFSGLVAQSTVGNTTDSDSFYKQFTIVEGATTGKTSITVTADYSSRNSLKLADRDYSATGDLRSYGGTDARSSLIFPGRVTVPGLGTVTYAAPTTTPTVAAAVPYNVHNNGYNFNPVTDLLPKNETYGFFTRFQHELSDSMYAFAELSWHRNDTTTVVAASPVSGGAEQGTSAAGQMLFPASNPYNPFGVDIAGSALAFRLVEIGGRTAQVISDSPRILAGLGGKLPLNDWTWEASAMQASNDVTVLNTNQALDRNVQAALNGIRGPVTGRMLYLNPFGPNDPELINFLRSNFSQRATQRLRLYDGTVSGSLFDLPGGAVGLAVGVESRDESLRQLRSADEQAGQVIGGSEGQSSSGDRKVQSAYAEVRVPLYKNAGAEFFESAEAQVAGRFEDYSDFGTTAKPKFALSVKVTPWLLARGSFSKSFKAPDLPQLFNGGTVSFTSANVQDPRRPADPLKQLKIVTIGNTTLQPETTDTYYGGIVLEPKKEWLNGMLRGLTMSVDYFKFDGTNTIANFGGTTILTNELASPIFGSRVIRATPTAADIAAGLPGALLFVNDSFQNVSTQVYKGWDFEVRYERTTSFGRWSGDASLTYINSLNVGGFETVASFAVPRVRANVSLNWAVKDWTAAVFGNYIGHYADAAVASSAASQGGNGLLNDVHGTWFYNPQVSYRGFKGYTLTLGADNVLDKNPPHTYTSFTSNGYDNLTYSGEGRFVYLKVSREF